jgi:hypothetical protein
MKYLSEFGETVLDIVAVCTVVMLVIANIILWGCTW